MAGAGNDVYFVDNAGDQTVENAGQGDDVVFSTVSHTLAANVERLVLQGSANLSGTGIDGGKSQRVAKGDMIMVPAKTPHWFGEIDGALVLMSIHLPLPAGATR